MIRYFAYGSNLVAERMRERGAAFHSARPAVLRDHRLAFDKRSADGSARANVERHAGARVHGVVYELPIDRMEVLLQFEGGYDLVEGLVESPRPDGGLEVLTVRLFVARPDRRTAAAPLRSYVALLLQGIREHQLPEAATQEVARALERKGCGGLATTP